MAVLPDCGVPTYRQHAGRPDPFDSSASQLDTCIATMFLPPPGRPIRCTPTTGSTGTPQKQTNRSKNEPTTADRPTSSTQLTEKKQYIHTSRKEEKKQKEGGQTRTAPEQVPSSKKMPLYICHCSQRESENNMYLPIDSMFPNTAVVWYRPYVDTFLP